MAGLLRVARDEAQIQAVTGQARGRPWDMIVEIIEALLAPNPLTMATWDRHQAPAGVRDLCRHDSCRPSGMGAYDDGTTWGCRR